MKEIILTKGKVAIVDDDDFLNINSKSWYAYKEGNTYYAARDDRSNQKRKRVLMHREILNTPYDLITDHKDRNGLNNIRSNIRICTKVENNRNTKLRNDSTSGIKGVSFKKREKKWAAQISFNKKIKWLGYFNTAKEAMSAYDNASILLHGDFASPNMGKVAFG